MRIAVINGPNLNFLGIREPGVYGSETYQDLIRIVKEYGEAKGYDMDFFQSNSEGAIIDYLQGCYFEKIDGIIINPGAFTHYSYAIRDAIASISIPTVEVHLSNIHEREGFRSISVVEEVCKQQIYGKKIQGYLEAIDYLEKTEDMK
jgi:3-dehydroquinate dehydratase-2